MAAKIIPEIDSFSSITHLKIGLIFLLFLLLIFMSSTLLKQNDFLKFKSKFSYIEGLEIGSKVVLAGIQVGNVNDIKLTGNNILVNSSIDRKYDLPKDSIIMIRTNGIFGKKSLLIEPGFGDVVEDDNFIFTNTKDSYSIDMFLRYLNSINE